MDPQDRLDRDYVADASEQAIGFGLRRAAAQVYQRVSEFRHKANNPLRREPTELPKQQAVDWTDSRMSHGACVPLTCWIVCGRMRDPAQSTTELANRFPSLLGSSPWPTNRETGCAVGPTTPKHRARICRVRSIRPKQVSPQCITVRLLPNNDFEKYDGRREHPSPMPEYHVGGACLADGDLTMAAHAPGWFEAVKSPNGWTYTLNPADREPMPWPAWFRWFLGAGAPSSCSARGSLGCASRRPASSGWAADRAVPGLAGLVVPRRRGGTRDRPASTADRPVRAEARRGGDPRDLAPGADLVVEDRPLVRRRAARGGPQVVLPGRESDGGEPGDYHVLVAEDETGRRRDLVANYPRDMLLALAVELSSRWKAPVIDPDVDGVGAGKLAVVEDTEVPTDIRERRDLPLGSRLICEHLGGRGVRITKPPDGLAPHCGMPDFHGRIRRHGPRPRGHPPHATAPRLERG